MRRTPAVLLVDDDDEARRAARDALLAAGYRVTEARSGAGALVALRLQRFDVVVLDLWLPGEIDGWEVRRRQLAHPAWREIPVVIARAAGNLGPSVRHLAPAATIAKPIDSGALLATVARVLAPDEAPAG